MHTRAHQPLSRQQRLPALSLTFRKVTQQNEMSEEKKKKGEN